MFQIYLFWSEVYVLSGMERESLRLLEEFYNKDSLKRSIVEITQVVRERKRVSFVQIVKKSYFLELDLSSDSITVFHENSFYVRKSIWKVWKKKKKLLFGEDETRGML